MASVRKGAACVLFHSTVWCAARSRLCSVGWQWCLPGLMNNEKTTDMDLSFLNEPTYHTMTPSELWDKYLQHKAEKENGNERN